MKLLVVLALVTLTVARPGDKYDSKYDHINVQEITQNVRLLKGYTDCFNDKGKCTQDANDIKGLIPDAIQDDCAKCTDKQKSLAAAAIAAIKDKLPEEYKALLSIHDPEGKNAPKLDAFVAKHNSDN